MNTFITIRLITITITAITNKIGYIWVPYYYCTKLIFTFMTMLLFFYIDDGPKKFVITDLDWYLRILHE